MTNEDAIRWLDNLKNDIGNPHYEMLWPYAQAIDEICYLLKEQDEIITKIADRKIYVNAPFADNGDSYLKATIHAKENEWYLYGHN